VNSGTERELVGFLARFSDKQKAHIIGKAIVKARPVRNPEELVEIVERTMPPTDRRPPFTGVFTAFKVKKTGGYGPSFDDGSSKLN
jgi:16S rRNA C1402 N4-methylase RsmH